MLVAAAPAWRRRQRRRRPSDWRPGALIPSQSPTPSPCLPPPHDRTPPSLTTEAGHSNSRLPHAAVAKQRRPPTPQPSHCGGGRGAQRGRGQTAPVHGGESPPPPAAPHMGGWERQRQGRGKGVGERRAGRDEALVVRKAAVERRRTREVGHGRRQHGAEALVLYHGCVPASRPAGCGCRWGAAIARKGRAMQTVLPPPSFDQRGGKPRPRLPSRPPELEAHRKPQTSHGRRRAPPCFPPAAGGDYHARRCSPCPFGPHHDIPRPLPLRQGD